MKPFDKYVGYSIAVGGCAAVLLCRELLSEVLADRAQLFPFLLAATAAAWWGGRGPGMLATLLGALLGIYFIMPPIGSLRIDHLSDGVSAGIFGLIGLAISHICGALHQALNDQTEKQFRVLTDSITQLVWTTNSRGDAIWFNQRWYDYTGAAPRELENRGWERFCDPDELPRLAHSWQAALVAGECWESTYLLRRKDGVMRWHLGRAAPVRDESGHVTRWCGTSTDIDDHVAAERALLEADARKDKYIATLAHELRNPLSAISSALTLWRRVPHDAAEVENVRAVLSRHVKHLVRLIDDLLDLARVSSGRIVLHLSPVDLATVISEALETVQPALTAAGHQVAVIAGDGPVYVEGDKARLKQVFVNVLQNAAKFTPGPGVISVCTQRRGGHAFVHVRDNGLGIPGDQLTVVFDAFYQVDAAFGRSQGGLGIGLSLCRQLVELHGGRIEAHSEGCGKGSEFVIELPALAAPPSVAAPPCEAEPSNLRRPVVPRRVLVVDDLRDSAESLAKALRTLGHEATPLFGGEHVVDWTLLHQPDVVLLDIAMPGLDGYEVARRLRRRPELNGVTLVALTGFGQPNDRRRAAAAGFDFHVTKPIDLDRLQELLWQVEDGHRPVTEEAVSCGSEAHIIFTEEEMPSL